MPNGHYLGLFAAYGTVVVLTLLIRLVFLKIPKLRPIWPAQGPIELRRPWLDFGLFFVAGIGVIAVGQLYQQNLLLPNTGPMGPAFEAINQGIIFLPIPLLLLIRRQGPRTALLPHGDLGRRVSASLVLATVAALVYVIATPASLTDFGLAFSREASEGRLAAHAVQVFMEDLAIAALLVRLTLVLRSEWGAGIAVACLFAAAHIPAMLGAEAPVEPVEWAHRGLDAAIGVIVMVGLLKTRDLLWLYPTHFVMDMAQFA